MPTWMLSSLRANAEQTTLYKHLKKSYIERGDLLTLALFDCSFQWFEGGFMRLKRLINEYAQGQMGAEIMHIEVVSLCTIASERMHRALVTSKFFETGSMTISAYDALNVLDAEFPLLLGGLTSQQEDAALLEHSVWSNSRDIPLPESPASPESVETPRIQPSPAIAPEALRAILPESPETPRTQAAPEALCAILPESPETPRTQAAPEVKPERPPYNNYHWPSPLARMIAKELGIAGKRCTHAQALSLLTTHWRLPDTATLLATSRQDIAEKYYPRDPYKPYAANPVRQLLLYRQGSRYC